MGREEQTHMADQADWFRAFVERSMQEVLESPEVEPDEDGDYPFTDGSSMTYVSVDPEPGLGVCVWSYAAYQVKGSASVLREINELNMRSWLCKVVWRDGLIRVEQRLAADMVSVESLCRACWHVDGTASDIGAMFAVVHGGESVLAEPRAS
jgi:hypothetical protein